MDARSERWREHRKKVRSEIVDAAFRAIDQLGPDLSLREIAEEAGTAKPKIYRHFTDKSDLFQAIGERLRDVLWAAIFPSINLASDPAREVIRRSVEQYVRLVDEHPNVCRFLIQGRFAERLHQLSSRWQGIEWLECDPIDDHFKVSVYYGSDRGTYHLEANGSQGSGPTIVRVNPPHWLAHARYLGAAEESFEYHGDEGSERIELQTLAGDLSDALRLALGQ